MRRFVGWMLCLGVLVFSLCPAAQALEELTVSAPSAVLQEVSTGQILMQKDADTPRPMASVTKLMTALLVFEALDNGSIALADTTVCSKNVSSMTGSRVFLSEGERISVEELLKGLLIASGNDAAVALAEMICGNESSFVARMNQRAEELGLKNTHFVNCTGLDADGHATSAADLGTLSRYLLQQYPQISDYTTIWLDSLRDGTFTLANTNKLVRYYDGCTGLKTGSTSIAKYCLSASAQRDGMQLIAVVLGAETSDQRFADARAMLDWGFANYKVQNFPADAAGSFTVPVLRGKEQIVTAVAKTDCSVLIARSTQSEVETVVTLAQDVEAPVETGQKLGEIQYVLDGKTISSTELVAQNGVEELTFFYLLDLLVQQLVAGAA